MTTPRPLRIAAPDETLARTRARATACGWHEMPDDGGGACGANCGYRKALRAHRVEGGVGWRMRQAALDCFAHFTAPVEGIDLQFTRGRGPMPGRFRR